MILSRLFKKKKAGRRLSELLPIGFHGDRYLLDLVDLIAGRCECFIETGANVGSTLAYMAQNYPHMKCLSCEPDPEAYKYAIENTIGLGNIKIFNETSQEFIFRLRHEYKSLFDGKTMFWLDAHGYGFKWPLKDEIAFITSEFMSGYILIDDFKVPGRDDFLYDTYKGQICSLDFVKGTFDKKHVYNVYYPAYTEKTSPCHPLCGWCLIEFDNEPLVLPDGLKQNLKEIRDVRF